MKKLLITSIITSAIIAGDSCPIRRSEKFPPGVNAASPDLCRIYVQYLKDQLKNPQLTQSEKQKLEGQLDCAQVALSRASKATEKEKPEKE